MPNSEKGFRILSLDGGGAKGVYTLGILKEVEALAGRSLWQEFDLIYGTSTGAIIAAMLALGKTVDEIKDIYFGLIPDIMCSKYKSARTAALKKHAHSIFGEQKFDAFKTDVGIVTTHYDQTRPMIFKSSVKQVHGRMSTFEAGFGCTIADAVIASGAAFPFFERARVVTSNQGEPDLIDGGFIANNPTLLAIADAVEAYRVRKEDIKALSLGVGVYKEPQRHLFYRLVFRMNFAKLVLKILEANTTTIEQLRVVLFPDISAIRINDSFPQNDYQADMLESDPIILKKLNALGRESFAKHESALKALFGWGSSVNHYS